MAFDIFVDRIVKYIGSYALSMGRVDAIVFSGGIGEHSSSVREAVSKRIAALGVEIDESLNLAESGEDIFINSKKSIISMLRIKTDEELQIAKSTFLLTAP